MDAALQVNVQYHLNVLKSIEIILCFFALWFSLKVPSVLTIIFWHISVPWLPLLKRMGVDRRSKFIAVHDWLWKTFLGFLLSHYWGKEGFQLSLDHGVYIWGINNKGQQSNSITPRWWQTQNNVVLKSALEFKLNSSSFSIFT